MNDLNNMNRTAVDCYPYVNASGRRLDPMSYIVTGNDSLVLYPSDHLHCFIYELERIADPDHFILVIEPTMKYMVQKFNALHDEEDAITTKYLKERAQSKLPAVLKKIRDRTLNFLIITPEAMTDPVLMDTLVKYPPWLVVVDEAYHMLKWSTSHKAYREVSRYLNSFYQNRPIVAAFSPIGTEKERSYICKTLHIPEENVLPYYQDWTVVTPERKDCTAFSMEERLHLLDDCMQQHHNGSTVVYCTTEAIVETVHQHLSQTYPGKVKKCLPGSVYSGPYPVEEPEIVVTTSPYHNSNLFYNVAIHFDLPLSYFDYYNQVCGVGRDSYRHQGVSILLFSEDDIALNEQIIEEGAYPMPQGWQKVQLEKMVDVARDDDCFGGKQVIAANHGIMK